MSYEEDKIKLTIVIPTFNVGGFILKTLDCLHEQKIDHSLFEVLIINDGSTDDTELVVTHWIKQKNANNFKYYKKTNGNWGSVINYVKNNKLILGKYVSILDSDDLFVQDTLKEFLPHLNGKNELIISNYYENKNGKYKKAHVIFSKTGNVESKKCHTGRSIPLCKFYKSEIFYKIPNLRENVSYQDQILFHSLLLKTKKVFYIKKCLGIYWVERIGSSSYEKWNQSRISIWSENMNYLLELNSDQVAAYVMMMSWYVKQNINKDNYIFFNIKESNIKQYKNAKFNWLPFGTRHFSKLIFWMLTKKMITKK